MSFGQTLRTAREAKGITASELASRTHLLVQIIDGLENEDFRRIPAPIYGRGFVKLYCEVVGLDPKPLQAEFMALYTLNKEAPTKTARSAPSSVPKEIPAAPSAVAEPPPPPPQSVSVPEPQHPVEEANPEPEPLPPVEEANPEPEPLPPVEEATSEPEPEPAPSVKEEPPKAEPLPTAEETNGEPEPPPRRSYGELFEQTYAQEEPEKPSAAEKFRDTMSNVSHGVFANVKKLPPNTGRIVLVCIAAIILFVLIGWGIAALYKATTPQSSGEETQKVKTISQTKPETAAKPSPTTDKATSSTKSLPVKRETPTSKTSPQPTKRTAARGDGKTTTSKPGSLKSSGIEIPSLYID